jgi:monooxygenase
LQPSYESIAELDAPATEHCLVDVLIVGAGLSGIAAAHHLRARRPRDSFLILEARASMGGTWDLFRYPGIRSDSDMQTLGFSFRPWRDRKAIADGSEILEYIRATAEADGANEKIRYGHRVVHAAWSTVMGRWVVDVEVGEERTPARFSCRFLFMCSGYYDYAGGHMPEWPGMSDYRGQLIHPQDWPSDLDYAGKKVIVIGSGATAVTLVPAMAETAGHVTMLQRSPTYIVSRPARDAVADRLHRYLPNGVAHALARWKNIAQGMYFYRLARRHPARVKNYIIRMVRNELGPGFDVATHFTPTYNPWDQRLCLVPNGDLFKVLRDGRASVVTDTIERFTADGLKLSSGAEIKADIIVAATGLRLQMLGGMTIAVDGRPIDLARRSTTRA